MLSLEQQPWYKLLSKIETINLLDSRYDVRIMPYKWTFDGQLSLVDYSKNTVGQLPNCLTGLPRLSNRYQHQSSSNHRLHSALSVALLYTTTSDRRSPRHAILSRVLCYFHPLQCPYDTIMLFKSHGEGGSAPPTPLPGSFLTSILL